MKKLRIFLYICIIVSQNIFSQNYWLQVPSPTTKWLQKSYFVDSVYGWACGDSGAIVSTTNSGQNWTLQNSGVSDYPIDDIFFTSRTNGWALANDYLFNGTIILRTTNGGQVWTNYRYPDTTLVFNNIYFLDPQTGYMSGFIGRIFKTTNGGVNWFENTIDTAFCPYLYLFPKNQFQFINAQTGYVAGGQIDIQGMVWKTTNGGQRWFTYCITPEPLFDIEVVNQNKIIACGGDFEYGPITGQSYNSGQTWLYDTIAGSYGQARSMAFRTPSELWVPLSFAQKWGLNLDSGSVESLWYQVPQDSISVINVVFKSPTKGWAFGNNGVKGIILKYNTGLIGVIPNSTPVNFKLFQNYPNPFNPSTTITYSLAKPEFVKITIFDLLGKQVKLIIEGIKPAGTNSFKFINSALASGIYIYKVEAGEYSDTKKMVLLK